MLWPCSVPQSPLLTKPNSDPSDKGEMTQGLAPVSQRTAKKGGFAAERPCVPELHTPHFSQEPSLSNSSPLVSPICELRGPRCDPTATCHSLCVSGSVTSPHEAEVVGLSQPPVNTQWLMSFLGGAETVGCVLTPPPSPRP